MRAVPAIAFVLISLLLLPTTARAEDPVEVSRQVIARQIEAFLKDDADTAYFFAMVRKSYAPVYRPGNYAFGRSKAVGEGAMVLHELTISGRDGTDWKAVYKLSRQPDGSYKIDGVMIAPDRVSKEI